MRHEPPSPELREEVEEEIVRLLCRAPHLASPGLLGTRLEHLAICRDDPETLKLLSRIIAKIAFGEIPTAVLGEPEVFARCRTTAGQQPIQEVPLIM